MTTLIEQISEKERYRVLKAMRATVANIDENELQTRTGVDVDEFLKIIERWPDIEIENRDEDGFLAVHNSLNEVCNGFKIEVKDWDRWFDVPMSEVMATYRRWCALTGVRGGIR
jgi:hypothetical protein